VEDETADGGRQLPLCRPVRKVACPVDQVSAVSMDEAATGESQQLLHPRPAKRARTEAGGSQQPLHRPLRNRACPVPKLVAQEAEEMEEDNEDSEEEEGQKLPRVHNKERLWLNVQPKGFGKSVPDFHEEPLKPIPDECQTAYDFYKLFMPDEFVDELVRVSRLYAVKKGNSDLQAKITNNSLRTTQAIMYLTGYLTPSNRLMFWEQKPDTGNMFVKKAMSRNLFMELIRNTYFTDRLVPSKPEDADYDRHWKVRPLIEHINSMARKHVRISEHVSIDEGMIKYFGPHPLKQFIRGKPIRFGYKMWILANSTGELLWVQPYAGSSTHIEDFGLGQGPNVVMGLAQQCGLPPGTKVYVDNLFTSLDLIDHMGAKGYGVTGTLRQNRIIGIPLPNKKQANKELKRGETKMVFTQDAVVSVWKDNQPVYMASNCANGELTSTCKRYSRVDRGYVNFTQPNMNNQYNKHMGGVDMLDARVKNYAISIRVRKWYWCFYTWFLGVQMVQAWRHYRAHMKEQHKHVHVDEETKEEMKKRKAAERKIENIPLLDFTRQVVELTVMKHSDTYDMAIPQREVVTSVSKVAKEEIRLDEGNHLIMVTELRGVCRKCKNRTTFRCARCDVALHPTCFYYYHRPQEEPEKE